MIFNEFTVLGGFQTFVFNTHLLTSLLKNIEALLCAVGIALGITYLLGLIYPFKRKKEDAMLLALVASFFIFFNGWSKIGMRVSIIPVFALLSSRCLIALHKKNISKYLIPSTIAVLTIFSLFYTGQAMYCKLNDSRTQAARYIAENIPPNTTIGFGVYSLTYNWLYHRQKYPRVDWSRYKEAHFLQKPQIIILSSNIFSQFKKALQSDKLSPEYLWDKDYPDAWFRSEIPPPYIFRLYDELLNNKTGEYALVKTFKNYHYAPQVYDASPEIRIYKKVQKNSKK